MASLASSEDRFFPCPGCGEENAISLNVSEGLQQEFVVDCVVCCKPILVKAEFDYEGIKNFDVILE